MALLFLDVGWIEGFFFKHHKLPFHGVEHVEFDLVYLVLGLGVDEEVFMVEEGVNKEIRTILDVVYLAS